MAAGARSDSSSGNLEIWLTDLLRNTPTRFTFHPGPDFDPVWSPDGKELIYYSSQAGGTLFRKAASGAGNPVRLLESADPQYPTSWSSDGGYLLYTVMSGKDQAGIMALPLKGDRKPFVFLNTPFSEAHARFSPDGRWIAYESNESGTFQIYVQAFSGKPASGAKWQISTNGGTEPQWRGDGKELFYLGPNGAMMSVSVTASVPADGGRFQSGAPVVLISSGIRSTSFFAPSYTVTRDGKRFLVGDNAPDEQTRPITLVVNWQAASRR